MAVQRGCLALADISGYTKYLAGVELEHSHDILADLIGVVVGQLRGAMSLAKLEGDAVFCYTVDTGEENDGSTLMTAVEACYFAFQRRVQDIQFATSCSCDACRRIPHLSLKFLVHHGRYVLHEVVGSPELVGPDVIVAHRLLKNRVTDETGLRGYAMFTRACLDEFALDPSVLGMRAHRESYEDVGDVECFVYDLEARWREELDRRAVYLPAEEAFVDVTADLPGAPSVVWDYLTNPVRRVQWQPYAIRVDQENPRGSRGVGTTNHCVHGDSAVLEEVLDWKPYRYCTFRVQGGFGDSIVTIELTPLEGGVQTRVAYRLRPEAAPEQLEAMIPARDMVTELVRAGFDTIDRLLTERGDGREAASPASA